MSKRLETKAGYPRHTAPLCIRIGRNIICNHQSQGNIYLAIRNCVKNRWYTILYIEKLHFRGVLIILVLIVAIG